MITATVEVKRHEEYGELGLQIIGREWAEPLDGTVIAHDLLEHFPRDNGDIEGELMALGASLHVRDGANYYYRVGRVISDPAPNFASDLLMQVSSYGGDNYTLRPIASRAIEDLDDYILRAVKTARSNFPDEFGDSCKLADSFLAQPTRVIGWMRRGYRRAVRRYGDVPSWKLCQTFINAANAANKFLKHSEEGYRAKIQIDVRSEQTRVFEIWDWE